MLTFDGLWDLVVQHNVHRPLLERAVTVAVVLLDEASRSLLDEHDDFFLFYVERRTNC